jgi:hypothetical protein
VPKNDLKLPAQERSSSEEFQASYSDKEIKKRKRNMRKDGEVAKSHMDFVKRLLRLK